jgi:transcriptional regulator with XRE-family HTH domain
MKLAPFGQWLQSQIANIDTNWAGLAQLLGVHHTTINHWKTGVAEPSTDNIAKLASVLGVPVELVYEELGRIAAERDLPEDVRRIMAIAATLSPEDRATLEAVARTLLERQPGRARRAGGEG